jgi:hypothetical protein
MVHELHCSVVGSKYATVSLYIIAFVVEVFVQLDGTIQMDSASTLSGNSGTGLTRCPNTYIAEFKQSRCSLCTKALPLSSIPRSKLDVRYAPSSPPCKHHELLSVAPVESNRFPSVTSGGLPFELDPGV